MAIGESLRAGQVPIEGEFLFVQREFGSIARLHKRNDVEGGFLLYHF